MYKTSYSEDLLIAFLFKLTHILEGFNMINKLLYTRLIDILIFFRFYQRKCPNCLICSEDNNLQTPRNMALLGKLTDSLLVRKFPEF
jgi:hypothetical protein